MCTVCVTVTSMNAFVGMGWVRSDVLQVCSVRVCVCVCARERVVWGLESGREGEGGDSEKDGESVT